jgi:hypothetical protein
MVKRSGGVVPAIDPLGEAQASLPFPRPARYQVTTAAADEINGRRHAGGRLVVCGTSRFAGPGDSGRSAVRAGVAGDWMD